jgi:hypothetical protein
MPFDSRSLQMGTVRNPDLMQSAVWNRVDIPKKTKEHHVIWFCGYWRNGTRLLARTFQSGHRAGILPIL